MITPMQMYWLLKLDDICENCKFLTFFGFVALAIIALMFNYGIEDRNEKIKQMACTLFKLVLFGIFLLFGLVTFLPSTKQMAAIYVVPAIANNEKIQQIGGKTLDISNQLLDLTKDYLEERAKNK